METTFKETPIEEKRLSVILGVMKWGGVTFKYEDLVKAK